MKSIRRFRSFNIFYTDQNVSVDEGKEAVAKELDCPGKLLGYWAMHKKVRQERILNVSGEVHDLDSKAFEAQNLRLRV